MYIDIPNMKKIFKLEKVLKFRETVLNIESKKLLNLFEMHSTLTSRRDTILSEMENNNSEMEGKMRHGKFELVHLYQSFIAKLMKMLDNIENEIDKLNSNIEIQRKIVIERRNDKKIMENLKERHEEKYKIFLQKEELKMIDEINSIRYKKNYNYDENN